jgi:hypothetical protein
MSANLKKDYTKGCDLSTHVGSTTKRSSKWYDCRDARVNRSKEHTSAMLDTSSNGYDLLTEEDMDIFIRKVNAINAHLDSLYSKSEQQEDEQEDVEVAKKRLPVCFKCAPTPEQQARDEEKRYIADHRRVVKDILLHLRYYRVLRSFQEDRHGYDVNHHVHSCKTLKSSSSSAPSTASSSLSFEMNTPRSFSYQQEHSPQTTMVAHVVEDKKPPARASNSFTTPLGQRPIDDKIRSPNSATVLPEPDDTSII